MKIVWDEVGQRFLENGLDQGVLYPEKDETNGGYTGGVAWNGLTSLSESPSGGDKNDLYADNRKYASLRAAEDFGGTIEAYTYPPEFEACDGSAQPTKGVNIYQQARKVFGMSYRTNITNDQSLEAYKIHLVYGATVSPSERSYATTNDSPDATTLSWEFTTTPVNVEGYKPTALVTVDTRYANATKLKEFYEILYGTEDDDPRLPMPDEVISLLGETAIQG